MKEFLDVKLLPVNTPTVNNRIYKRDIINTLIKNSQVNIHNNNLFVVTENIGVDVDLTKICGVVTNLKLNDEWFLADIKLLDTFHGNIVQNLNVSFHTMIMATVKKEDTGIEIVQDDATLQYLFIKIKEEY